MEKTDTGKKEKDGHKRRKKFGKKKQRSIDEIIITPTNTKEPIKAEKTQEWVDESKKSKETENADLDFFETVKKRSPPGKIKTPSLQIIGLSAGRRAQRQGWMNLRIPD